MASKRPIVQRPVAQLPSGYAALLDDIKTRVRAAQLKAGLAVNRELGGRPANSHHRCEKRDGATSDLSRSRPGGPLAASLEQAYYPQVSVLVSAGTGAGQAAACRNDSETACLTIAVGHGFWTTANSAAACCTSAVGPRCPHAPDWTGFGRYCRGLARSQVCPGP